MIRKFPWLVWLSGAVLWIGVAAVSAEAPRSDSSDAIERAEQAISVHGLSAARLLALGQAELRQDRVGPAIANFERGLVLAPRDAPLRAALAQARERAGLPPSERVTPLRQIAHELSLREWAFGAFGSASLASIALVAWSLSKRRRGLSVALLALSLLGGVCAIAGTNITRGDLQRAYVLRDDSAVRQSPFVAASALTNLHAGESVKQLGRHGEYVYVETEQGVFGWMARDGLAPLDGNPS
ncbi:MAG TPA: hypothetical protein VHZ95_18245 [Polyangiales bacterium]|nr:hypothetical protein [Polyangiales bacterium]